MKWNDVLKRKKTFIGGEVVTNEGGIIFCHRIRNIRLRNDIFMVDTKWTALQTGSANGQHTWIFYRGPDFVGVNTTVSTPEKETKGRFSFTLPLIGTAVLIPKTGVKLDPAQIKGFKKGMKYIQAKKKPSPKRKK